MEQRRWGDKPYYSLDHYFRSIYGEKIYKVALHAGCTCPVRDGRLDDKGCIFCSAGGSGEFAADPNKNITEQIREAKRRVSRKVKDGKYIAYFQAYSGTYAPVERLRSLYTEAMEDPDVVALSVATRPDCLHEEVLELLSEMRQIKPVWIELGLQTIHPDTATYTRRGYELPIYDEAVSALRKRDIEVIVHVIIGLPGETPADMVETVRYVCNSGATGIKLQLLHVLSGTDLAKEYAMGKVQVLSEDAYIDILKECVKVIPENVVIHRLTGDGDKKILIAPKWSGNKKHVWNRIQREVI